MSAARIFPFRQPKSGPPGVEQLSLGIPTAAYPGRVATNSDLIVAVDRQLTSLLLPMGAADLSMTVLDPSSIVAYSLLSIDNEIVKSTGPAAGNIVPVSRGFDGTAPATHSSGAAVAGLVDAYHHNALVAEIEAIEIALGPNLSRIPSGGPFLVSAAFNFLAQTPGGNLVAAANVITLAPVPQGVNGTDTNHYLYISGGTGTAEAVKITGGTAVSGAPSGTVIVACANTHSGAWTVQSATSGIQEAIAFAGNNANLIVIPAGNQPLYAGIYVASTQTIALRGGGMGVTSLVTNGLTWDGITYDQCQYVDLGDFTITDSAGTFHTSGAGIKILNVPRGVVSHIEVYRAFDGMWACGGQAVFYSNIRIEHQRYGFYVHANGQPWTSLLDANNIHVSSLGGSGFNPQSFRIEGVTAGVRMNNLFAYNGGPADANYEALNISQADGSHSTNEINIANVELEGPVVFNGYGTFVNNSVTLTGGRINCSGVPYAIAIHSGINGVKFSNLAVTISGAPITAGILIDMAQNITFESVTLVCPGAANGVQFANTQNSNIILDGCLIGFSEGSPNPAPTTGIGAANADSVQISDCMVKATGYAYNLSTGLTNVHISGGRAISGTGAINGAGFSTLIIQDVSGVSDVVPAIASAAALSLPFNASFSLTGGVGVTSIVSPVAAGRQWNFTVTASTTFTLGPTIGNTVTITKWGSIFFDGTKAWITGV